KPVNVSVEGVHQLELVADKGDDAISYDHADWCDVVLTDKDGKKVNLSTLKPASASQDWGALNTNRSVDKNPLRVGGKEYKTGFGTHANGRLIFNLDGKYKTLEGFAGVDEEEKEKGTGTVRFIVKTAKPQKEAKIHAALAPRKDGRGLAVTKTPDKSPWRIIIVAPKAINLVDQTIVMNVSEPTNPNADWTWIQPGSASWDWWSDSNANMSTKSVKPFIDFAAEMGWQYHFVDDPWYAGKKYRMGDPRNNVLKGSDETDIEELVKYAKEKNIRLFLWLNWKDIDRQMDEAFAQYEKWGIAGVKIDFMDRDDQEMVEWYDKTVKKAAQHKLLVDFHGAYKPTGYRRTYPNLITREGIHGNEQNKWTKLTPEHYCTQPYTRLMLGPGDFTPGAFLNRHYGGKAVEGFKTAQGIGTRAHELAISFLYDSPIRCLCDSPEVYKKDSAGLDYYRGLPTVWDESKGVAGEVGEYFSLVRRSGNDWYYGAITNEESRTLTVPLTFLGRGRYEATIYADTPETDEDARKIAVKKVMVNSSGVLSVKLAKEGGQVIVFEKLDDRQRRQLRNIFRR
ncbi:MAG: glycoside hydrolase family 97 catalytic domain-containing protein, partial [Planctomycetaceae bacterium]|nr:glycoside hydrolase family 97 catalytic domain-containing protein [Planctomycetaceae bacterium]